MIVVISENNEFFEEFTVLVSYGLHEKYGSVTGIEYQFVLFINLWCKEGWNSLDTVVAAEGLGLTLQSSGSLKEAQELFERCLDARKTLLPEDHFQIGANMLHIARVVMLNSNQLRRMHVSDAIAELDKAKGLLNNAIRIAWQVINKLKGPSKKQGYGVSGEIGRDGRAALIILLQSLDALGLLEINRQELQESGVRKFVIHS
ncbi:hypothetical protein CRYUN_Cryun01aG0081400 [Craigia yunnanensis]